MHNIKSRVDLANRIAYHFETLATKRTALLVIDMQVGFMRPGYMPIDVGFDIADNINHLAAGMRKAGGMVVFTRHSFSDTGPAAIPQWQYASPAVKHMAQMLVPGHPAHEVDPTMDVQPSDIVINKYRYSALADDSSTLLQILRERDIESVIVTGMVTNACCESTARDAFFKGFKVFFIEDANGAVNDDEHNATLTSMLMAFADVRPTSEMLALIEKQ